MRGPGAFSLGSAQHTQRPTLRGGRFRKRLRLLGRLHKEVEHSNHGSSPHALDHKRLSLVAILDQGTHAFERRDSTIAMSATKLTEHDAARVDH